MSQILLYGGGIQEVEAQTGITKTENYLAVGMQVREYKKALKNLTGNPYIMMVNCGIPNHWVFLNGDIYCSGYHGAPALGREKMSISIC